MKSFTQSRKERKGRKKEKKKKRRAQGKIKKRK
jgi:hypothetical protein